MVSSMDSRRREALSPTGDPGRVVQHFQFVGDLRRASPYGIGHIHDTFAAWFEGSGTTTRRYILQRINHNVFRDPEGLMENVCKVTAHLRRKILDAGRHPERHTLNLIPTVEGGAYHKASNGHYWRAYVFIEGARTYEVAESLKQVYHAGAAFGSFQELLADFPAGSLHEKIPDFHDTPKRFQAFIRALDSDRMNRAAGVQTEIDFVLERASKLSLLVDLLAQGQLPERVTHNDTKFNNVMIDDETGEAVCVIDLDTVMPGLAPYDFGDAVRAAANTAPEDEEDLSRVAFDFQVYEHLTQGYLDAARGLLTDLEIECLPYSAWLMTLEVGLRFLTDHLDGDVYFRVLGQDHNLHRCRTQFKLVQDMEGQFEQMAQVIRRHR
jgi:Ser/Thr protein kinase RdoA (MazF antagonist)